MKKVLLLASGLLFFGATNLQAQNWVNKGNTLTGNGSIGTNSNHSLLFETNNTERGRITSTGLWGIGTGTTLPSAKFQINSTTTRDPLRVQVNTITKFLVSKAGGVSIGANVTPPANGLYVKGQVGIGVVTPAANTQLDVFNAGGDGIHATGNIYGLQARANNAAGYGIYSTGGNTGVYGSGGAVGVYGYSDYADDNGNNTGIGVRGYSRYGTAGYFESESTIGVGVFATGFLGINAVSNTPGGEAIRATSTGLAFIGVNAFSESGYGVSAVSEKFYGIYASTGNADSFAGYFDGNVFSTGTFVGTDPTLDQSITDLESGVALINQLKPKNFENRSASSSEKSNAPQGKQYGLLGQDLEKVLPSLVKEVHLNTSKLDPKATAGEGVKEKALDFKAVNYTGLIPIMIKAIQEQQQIISTLTDKIAKLEAVNSLGSNANGGSTGLMGTSLAQNQPNPFHQSTTFRYTVPANASAQILIYDGLSGALLKTVPAPATGQVELSSSNLPAGTYIYSLVVNGKQVDSKKMVLSK